MTEKQMSLPEGFADDLSLAHRLEEATHTERNTVMTILVEAKDIIWGGFNGMREHPIGSLEIGSAGVLAGLTAALALKPHRPRIVH